MRAERLVRPCRAYGDACGRAATAASRASPTSAKLAGSGALPAAARTGAHADACAAQLDVQAQRVQADEVALEVGVRAEGDVRHTVNGAMHGERAEKEAVCLPRCQRRIVQQGIGLDADFARVVAIECRKRCRRRLPRLRRCSAGPKSATVQAAAPPENRKLMSTADSISAPRPLIDTSIVTLSPTLMCVDDGAKLTMMTALAGAAASRRPAASARADSIFFISCTSFGGRAGVHPARCWALHSMRRAARAGALQGAEAHVVDGDLAVEIGVARIAGSRRHGL